MLVAPHTQHHLHSPAFWENTDAHLVSSHTLKHASVPILTSRSKRLSYVLSTAHTHTHLCPLSHARSKRLPYVSSTEHARTHTHTHLCPLSQHTQQEAAVRLVDSRPCSNDFRAMNLFVLLYSNPLYRCATLPFYAKPDVLLSSTCVVVMMCFCCLLVFVYKDAFACLNE